MEASCTDVSGKQHPCFNPVRVYPTSTPPTRLFTCTSIPLSFSRVTSFPQLPSSPAQYSSSSLRRFPCPPLSSVRLFMQAAKSCAPPVRRRCPTVHTPHHHHRSWPYPLEYSHLHSNRKPKHFSPPSSSTLTPRFLFLALSCVYTCTPPPLLFAANRYDFQRGIM